MKKKTIVLFSAALSFALGLASCDKIKDALFPSFETNSLTANFDIPVITNTSSTIALDTATIHFNLDSAIKANSGSNFDIDNVSSIKVDSVWMTLSNSDASNNMANFESAKLTFFTNTSTTPAQVASATIPDVTASTSIFSVSNSPELKGYLKGTEITYVLSGKARRATSKVLNASVKVKFFVQ